MTRNGCANPPSVSVLIPTFNHARFLAEAIESVLAQDFQDWELLIVDNCSTDDTAEVVRPFCSRDQRVRFTVNANNLGMVNNFNHCLKLARGKYVKYLCSDDKLWHPRALGRMVGLMEKYPSAVLAASARIVMDEHSNVVKVWRPLAEGCHDGRKIIAACLVEDGNQVGEPSAALFRKQDAQRGFDPKLRQVVDIEMWFHLLENGNLAYTREPLCGFRRHALQESALNDASGLAWKEHALFCARYATTATLPRKVRFHPLFALRRARRRRAAARDPEILEAEAALARKLGEGWYRCYWVYYKLTHPFHNLGRSLGKRLARWLGRPES